MKILLTGGSGFIGTNFTEFFSHFDSKIRIVNIDIKEPQANFENSHWIKCDILDKPSLLNIFREEQPNCVVHFAAETSCEPQLTMSDFEVNTIGAKNVFDAADSVKSVKTLIHTSTQFINQFDFPLVNFFNYRPHTVYGESKIESEKILRLNKYNFKWVIIRPTNIWGKWHLRYPYEFWKVLNEGKYIHPNKRNVIRSYGYVSNVCSQIQKIIEKIDSTNGDVYYVGDEPKALAEWVNGFSMALRGKNVRTAPPVLIKCIALFGDVLKIIGFKFPITSSRYNSMIKSNPAPMQKTFDAIGYPKYSLDEGIKETVKWLRSEFDY